MSPHPSFCHLCVVPAAPPESECICLILFVVHKKMEAQRRPESRWGLGWGTKVMGETL